MKWMWIVSAFRFRVPWWAKTCPSSSTCEAGVRILDRALFRYGLKTAKTTPLPPLTEGEPGLLTLDEFLRLRNPQDKHHLSESYDWSLAEMNRDYVDPVARLSGRGEDLFLSKGRKGYFLRDADGRLLGILAKGIWYYSNPSLASKLPTGYPTQGPNSEWVPLDVRNIKQVKYLDEYVSLVSSTIAENVARYPILLQRIKVKGQSFTVRAEKAPVPDEGTTLAILNDEGQVVAQASNEWGATLLVVAQEYRGLGLGGVLGRFWYDFNPSFTSGGFTPGGESNAIRMWESRVREFLSRGWYSELIRQGQMTVGRFREITEHLGGRRPRAPMLETPKPKAPAKTPLIMIDPGSYFYIYDPRVYEKAADDMTEDDILGYGFFRGSGDKVFLFALDYDRKYHRLATYVALQMARDAGYNDLWNGEGYSDLLELEGLSDVEEDGDYVRLTRDVLPLDQIGRLESLTRRKFDRYDEYKNRIMELADTKWR
jgi:GNAT superfamily N-acetyltransferase